jgi:hypothetical protein
MQDLLIFFSRVDLILKFAELYSETFFFSAHDGTEWCSKIIKIIWAIFTVLWFLYSSIAALVFAFTGPWFLAGNAWVFSVASKRQFDDPSLDTYCDRTLYLYSFWFIIVYYILSLIYACLCSCSSIAQIAYDSQAEDQRVEIISQHV